MGDWVAWQPGDGGPVTSVLPRRFALVRRAAGLRVRPQVICTNVDVVFVVTASGGDLNPRCIERYLAAIWQSGATPMVLLNKADLAWSPQADIAQVRAVSGSVPVLPVSAIAPGGLDPLLAVLRSAQTVALVGSSGVGKSTIVNALLGREQQPTTAVRRGDDHGRHTTTGQSLWRANNGTLLLDTAGMREFGLWDAEDGLDRAFQDVALLTTQCRFSDCAHQSEPSCAVQQAIITGALDQDRRLSYQKLQDELARTARAREERRRWEQRQDVRRFAKLVSSVKQRQRDRGG